METTNTIAGQQITVSVNKTESIGIKQVKNERLITDEDLKNGITGKQLKESMHKYIDSLFENESHIQ
jgi:antitoxin component of MazEF toxin-antitoxin module